MSQPRGCFSEAQQCEPDVFHISSCKSHPLTSKRPVGEIKRPGRRNMLLGRKTDRSVVRKMSIGLHEVFQATWQSLIQQVEKLLPKKTHTLRRFISSLTVPLRFSNCL